MLPPLSLPLLLRTSIVETKAQRAIKPASIALGVFGAIAALAMLLIAGQALGRQLRFGADDLDTLRALGAGPAMTSIDGLTGTVSAIVMGSVVAAAVAVGLSPLAPLGPVRRVYPSRGIAFDWTVLGLGIVIPVVLLGAFAGWSPSARRHIAFRAVAYKQWPADRVSHGRGRRGVYPFRRLPVSVSPSKPAGAAAPCPSAPRWSQPRSRSSSWSQRSCSAAASTR